MKTTVIVLLLAAALCPSAVAAKIKVPADFATIQAAVGAAAAGDVIEVSQGTYDENVVIDGRSDLTLQAKKGDKVTVDAGGGADPPLFVNNSDHIVVKSLRLRNTTTQGAYVKASDSVTLRQCTLTNMVQYGILIDGSTGALIDRCAITAPGGGGIELVSSDSCVASKNKIKNVLGAGFLADGDMHTFEANTIDTTGAAGIQLGDGVTGCSNALVSGNKITKAGADGISCMDDTQDCTILDNDVIDPENEGISARDGLGGHFISKNVLKSTGDYSIVIEADGCTIHKNSITTSAEDGIRIATECSGALVIKNTITKCLDYGVRVIGTGNTFVANKASKSGLFDLSDGTLSGENVFINNKFGTIEP